MKKLLKNSTFFIFLVLIAMCVFTAIAEPAFLKISNILSTARAFSSIAIAGIGVLMVILTGGIDVGAKKEIHQLMSDLANQGVAIIMISSELPEVLGMSDRVVVMHEGHIKGELSREEADQVSIMKMAVS